MFEKIMLEEKKGLLHKKGALGEAPKRKKD